MKHAPERGHLPDIMRFAGAMKMGYYPTPEKVTEQILERICAPDEGKIVRLLDPCAGEGIALARVGEQMSLEFPGKVETYGIEPDEARAEAAKARLNHVIKGGYETVMATNDVFSLLWYNPPYDDSTGEDGKGERNEYLFLKDQSRWLSPGGILVAIVPQKSLHCMANLLVNRFFEIRVERFDDKEYDDYQQVVLLARKKAFHTLTDDDLLTKERLMEIAAGDKDTIPSLSTEPDYLYELPASRNGKITFVGTQLDEVEMAKALPESPVWVNVKFLTNKRKAASLRNPPLPLRKTHYATVIASGALNGAVGKGTGRHLLVGFSRKVSETETSMSDEGATKTVRTERFEGVTRIFTPSGVIKDLI